MTDNRTCHDRNNRTTAGERRLSLALLGILALIAVIMIFIQGRYDSGAWREQAQTVETGAPTPQPKATPAAEDTDMAVGLIPLSSAEIYTAETLSDKINGKADLYLSAGFQKLTSRRFALTAEKNRWMERYAYDMGSLRNAYAVFSVQRRQQVQPVDVTAHAYLASNGLFFVHGPFYVEIIAAEAATETQQGMTSLARAFVSAHAVPTEDLPELSLLPADHRISDSVKLAARSAFGIEGLNGVFTAGYAADQAEAMAFVRKCASRNEAKALAEKFHAFWLDFGGETMAPPENLPEVRIVFILDNYEISLVEGDYLLGVHEATHLEFGLALVKQLQYRIIEGAE
ncbi:MAG: hypothetical protein RBT11_06745 [Desulfobacterales bacterium]|jgi:hypothetical protein|nr:hypothetical protein [Desulfobacterales bacterium]